MNFSIDGFVCVTDDNYNITIVRYNGEYKNLILPLFLVDPLSGKAYPVTSIGYNAFTDRNMTSVILHNKIVHIGARAFAGNSQMTSVTIPSSVESISNASYKNGTLVIPEGTIYIDAFEYENLGIQSILFPSTLLCIGSAAFKNNMLTSLIFPTSLISIGAFSFYKNQIQTTGKLPPFVGTNAFDCQDVRAPDVRASDVRAFDVKAFDVKASDVRAFDVKAFDVKAFDVKAFDVKAFDVKAFDVKAFDVKAFDVRATEWAPDVRANNINDKKTRIKRRQLILYLLQRKTQIIERIKRNREKWDFNFDRK